LDLEEGVRRALSGVQDVVLHFGEEETSDLGAVVHEELFVEVSGFAQHGDDSIFAHFGEVVARNIDLTGA